MSFNEEQKKLLSAKLSPDFVRPAQKFGPKGDYIEGWHAIAEANRIFGFDGWSYTVDELKCVSEREKKIGANKDKDGFGVSYTALVRVSVDGLIREDIGAGHGHDVDCGMAHESAIKEAVTDGLKRALRSFGNPFGLALYDKTRENVGFEPVEPVFSELYYASIVEMKQNTNRLNLKEWYGLQKDGLREMFSVDERAAFMNELSQYGKGLPEEVEQQKEEAK